MEALLSAERAPSSEDALRYLCDARALARLSDPNFATNLIFDEFEQNRQPLALSQSSITEMLSKLTDPQATLDSQARRPEYMERDSDSRS